MSDLLLLVTRLLLGWVFFIFAWNGSPNSGYLTALGFSSPEFWSIVARVIEFAGSLSLIFGIGVRYGALLLVLYCIVATAAAHRYWQSPAAQVLAQFTNFTKNLAIIGGLLAVFVSGAGRFSIDRSLAGKP